jgi:predicted ester cyclase
MVANNFASDYLGHSVAEIHGPDGWKEWAATVCQAFPNSFFTVRDQIVEGDKVVTRWIASGIHAGDFAGHRPTGKMVKITGIDISRIANNKIIEGWMVMSIRSFNHE